MNGLRNSDAMRHLHSLSNRGWYTITNKKDDEKPSAEILIYDEIGWMGITAEDFVKDLQAVEADEIRVRINSPGGSVFGGRAIYNALRQHAAEIVTVVDSLAASAASTIVQAGDRRVMVQHSEMMIHDAMGIAIGNAEDMEEYANLLRKETNIIADIYAERSGKPRSMFSALMKAETWFDHNEAVEAGLADEVLIPERKGKDQDEPEDAATVDPQNSLEETETDETPEPPKRVEFGDLFENRPFATKL